MSTPRSRPIADRYDVLGKIGEGGAAIVYRARDLRLDRIVALKVLREAFGSDPEFRRRFQREARIAASLNHPNIVDVYDYGQTDQTYYIAMEHLDGGNLKEEIRRSGRLQPARARDVAQQVLSALGAAHARGLVHRDVKPQNVLLDGAGVAKLTDFGIAHGPDAAEVTQVGMTVGTAAYIAPEQATGGVVGPATDLYGVGILLYEMLTGRPPFEGGTPFEVAYRQVNEPVPPPSSVVPGVPADLEAITLKALQKDPLDRFGTAEEMSGVLSRGFGLEADATQPMATVRMPRVGPPRAAAGRVGYPPTTARPVAVAEPPRRRSSTALIVTLGVLGGLAMLALLLVLIAQELGFFGGAPRTPLPSPSPTVRPTVTAPAKAVVAPTGTTTASPTLTGTASPTASATATPSATPSPTQIAPTATAPPTSTSPPAPTSTTPPTATPVPLPTTPPVAPPTLTPTPPAKPAPSPTPVPPTATPTTPPKPAVPTPTPTPVAPPKPSTPTAPAKQ
jgi:serine/threonine-protein kinase